MSFCDDAAESDQRLDDEFEALAAIYGSDFRRTASGHHGCEISLPSRVSLVATLPAGYPTHAAAELTIRGGASVFPREQLRDLSQELQRLASDAVSGEGKGEGEGEECLWQAAQLVLDRLDGVAGTIAADTHATSTAGPSPEGEQEGQRAPTAPGGETAGAATVDTHAAGAEEAEELCLVLIDHMNNGRAYSKKIAAWAQQLSIAGRQLSRAAAQKRAPKAAAGAAGGGGGGGRLEGVIVLLLGDSSAISGWLTRLRTQYVDVNAKGLNCKERKSTVLSRGPAPPPAGALRRRMLAGDGGGAGASAGGATGNSSGPRHWVQQRYVGMVAERVCGSGGCRGDKDDSRGCGGKEAPLLASPAICFDALGLRPLFDACVVPALLPVRRGQ